MCFVRVGGEGNVGNEFIGCHGEGVRVGGVWDGGGIKFLKDGIGGEVDYLIDCRFYVGHVVHYIIYLMICIVVSYRRSHQ